MDRNNNNANVVRSLNEHGEKVARMLSGIGSVPPLEQSKMVARVAKYVHKVTEEK